MLQTWYNKCMKNNKKIDIDSIDLDTLSDEELIAAFGNVGRAIIRLRNKKNAEMAEMHDQMVRLIDAIEKKNYALMKQLLERFDPTKKPDIGDADEEYSDEKTEAAEKKAGSSAGRPKGSKTGGNIDFDRISVVDHSIGVSVAGGDPRTFFKIETIPARCILHRYKVYDDSIGQIPDNDVKELPDQFGDSFLTPSLGAYVATRKFLYGVPLYRLESILRDSGVGISRVQLADYCIRVADELSPISDRIAYDFIHSPERAKVRHADETTLKVVRNSRESGRTCRMFVYTSCKWDKRLSAVYRFCIDRKAENIIGFFVDYSGVVICDDCGGYDTLAGESLGQITLARCWFHWRKRFEEIVLLVEKSAPSEEKKKAALSKSYAAGVLKKMQRLFEIEKEHAADTADALLRARREQSRPIVDELFSDMKSKKESFQGSLKDAVSYGLNLEKDLRVFLDNPYVEMTNNVCERSVKDFVMARKNFLFSYSEKGAEAAGTLMTVIRTARLNQVDPEKYIAYVLSQLGKTRQSDIDSLLPWSESLPKEVRSSKYEVPKAVTDSLKENRYK